MEKKKRPWIVTYDLDQDYSGLNWVGYFRTHLGARLSVLKYRYCSSWRATGVISKNKKAWKNY